MKAFIFPTQQTQGFIAFDIHGKFQGQDRTFEEVQKQLEAKGFTEFYDENHNVIVKGKFVHARSDNYSMKLGEIYDLILVPGIFDGTPYFIIPVDGKDPGRGGFHTYRFEILTEGVTHEAI